MNFVLVDSSVWIAYFRGQGQEVCDALDSLLSDGVATVNELILTELLPLMRTKRELVAAELLGGIGVLPLTIEWAAIRALSERCLRNGVNGVGIPDLLIAHQAIKEKTPLFTIDKHFGLIRRIAPSLKLWHSDPE